MNIKNEVNELLRNLLIEHSLKEKNKELFLRMTSSNWEDYLVCPESAKEYVFHDKLNVSKDSFLLDKYVEDNRSNENNVDEYIKNTTVTDVFEEKKTTLHQLIMLSKSLNKTIHDFINKIYNDQELIHLLTFTSEKKYRNAVFYLDNEADSLKIKDIREDVKTMELEEAVEFYRLNGERFFIEIKMAETM